MNPDGHGHGWHTRMDDLDVKNTNPEGENINPKFPDLGSHDQMAR
jgi:hypothetical protein